MNKQERVENRKKWAERVSQWEASGLTAGEFAAKENIQAHTLRQWAYRLKIKKGSPSNPVQFVEIGAPHSQATSINFHNFSNIPIYTASPIEVVLQNGRHIRVPVNFDPISLRRVIDALENR